MTTFAAVVMGFAAVLLAALAALCIIVAMPPRAISSGAVVEMLTLGILSICASVFVAYCAGKLWGM